MPALTVKAVTKALSDYVRPDEDIVAKLNMVMPRLYAMGMWRDLLYDWSIETTNDYFALPEHAESLIGAMLENSPVEAQSQWHDYRISGYASDGPAPIFGVVDDGYHPTKEDLIATDPSDASQYLRCDVAVRPVAPDTTLPVSGKVEAIIKRRLTSTTTSLTSVTWVMDGSASIGLGEDDIIEVESISFEDIPEKVEVYGLQLDTSLEFPLAVVRGDGVVRYRRFRFANSGQTANIKLLLKRAWEPVLKQSDVIYLGNLNAIKHGLLGMLAEDNADLERAQYHWTICRQLLDEELDATRGAAKPKLIIKPFGNQINIPNII